jgi:coenzyme PQQ precursor peptide PqqA
MKIMRDVSWVRGSIEGAGIAPCKRTRSRGTVMKWETPQAVELRFGMEITMYVANR